LDYFAEYSTEEDPIDFPDDLEITVVDMNGDGIPEVILNHKGPYIRLVLSYQNGTVVGSVFGYKALGIITTDGTFFWGYATYHGLGRLRLTEISCEVYNVASFKYATPLMKMCT